MEETKIPGILVLVTGIFNLLIGLAALAGGAYTLVQSGTDGLPNALLALIGGLLNLILGPFVAFGGLKLKNGESYNLAMAACVLAMIPACSGCCLLGLPAGIMGILAMRKDEVKNNFR